MLTNLQTQCHSTFILTQWISVGYCVEANYFMPSRQLYNSNNTTDTSVGFVPLTAETLHNDEKQQKNWKKKKKYQYLMECPSPNDLIIHRSKGKHANEWDSDLCDSKHAVEFETFKQTMCQWSKENKNSAKHDRPLNKIIHLKLIQTLTLPIGRATIVILLN